MKVLLIEDDAMTAMLVKAVLKSHADVTLSHATTGHAGLESARETQPHIVLVDQNLPDGSGSTFAEELRKELGAKVKILSFSASDVKQTPEQVENHLYDGRIPKPFDPAKLLLLLQGHMDT